MDQNQKWWKENVTVSYLRHIHITVMEDGVPPSHASYAFVFLNLGKIVTKMSTFVSFFSLKL